MLSYGRRTYHPDTAMGVLTPMRQNHTLDGYPQAVDDSVACARPQRNTDYWAFCGWGCVMSVAMKLIVDAYVSLKNRQALEDMREHRQRLKRELLLKQTDAFDFSNSIRAFDDEVVVIETGLQRLGGGAVAH
jgi:hypothetical protein